MPATYDEPAGAFGKYMQEQFYLCIVLAAAIALLLVAIGLMGS